MGGAIAFAAVFIGLMVRACVERAIAAYDRRTDAIVKAKIGEVG